MPIYVYVCPKCNYTTEIMQQMGSKEVPLCCSESCSALEMERVISSSTFVLKGSGWAKDGYSGSGGKK